MQPEAAVVLADFEDPDRAGVLALDTIGFLPEESDTESLGGLRRARVFAGYAGWGAGQLEAEIAEDAWHATPAMPGDVFTDDPGGSVVDGGRAPGPGLPVARRRCRWTPP